MGTKVSNSVVPYGNDWFSLLTTSIIVQAVNDFRYYLKRAKTADNFFDMRKVKAELMGVVNFVNSQWFEDISPIRRSVMAKKLIEDAKDILKEREFYKEIMEGLYGKTHF